MTNYHDIQHKNNAYGTFSTGYSNSDTTLVLTTGHGARFPDAAGDKYFFATVLNTSNNLEIIKVTARSGDSLTVQRAQEGTTAQSIAQDDRIELRITAGTLTTLSDIDELVPPQSGNNGKVLTSNGTALSWQNIEVANFMGQNNQNESFFSLPKGTTAQRPGTPNVGMIRYNTDYYGGARPEFYSTANSWLPLNSPILNKYVICASAGSSGQASSSAGKFPSSGANWTTDGHTLNEFTLTPVNTGTHNILAVVLKPAAADSVFLIEVSGAFYSGSGYAYATIGRSTGETASATSTAASTLNVAHLLGGGDGTSVSATAEACSRWHLNAHVHTGGFAVYDKPNTTNFVRYCIHFAHSANDLMYFPHRGIASMVVTELDGTGTTKVSYDSPLEVAS
tara:strand:+ start:9480 stop:10661 length:1182 start_codon:yes stop_codon:yes gene_type:complete